MNLQEQVTALMFAENDTVFPHCGVVSCDGEVFEWAGLPQEEEQLRLVDV
jgi:hypothetical protein